MPANIPPKKDQAPTKLPLKRAPLRLISGNNLRDDIPDAQQVARNFGQMVLSNLNN
jgi:hypothetical protein